MCTRLWDKNVYPTVMGHCQKKLEIYQLLFGLQGLLTCLSIRLWASYHTPQSQVCEAQLFCSSLSQCCQSHCSLPLPWTPSQLSTRPTCSRLSLFNTYYLLHKSFFIFPSGANATHTLCFCDALHYSPLDISLYFLISGLSSQLLNCKLSEGRSTFYKSLYR